VTDYPDPTFPEAAAQVGAFADLAAATGAVS
jgi:hypothetical protein